MGYLIPFLIVTFIFAVGFIIWHWAESYLDRDDMKKFYINYATALIAVYALYFIFKIGF